MRALLLSTLSLAFIGSLVACPPGTGPVSEGEGEVEVLDGGVEGEGEAGEGEGEVGGGEGEGEVVGEGEGEVQGEPYTTGAPEDGVVCGDATCADPDSSCCFSVFGSAPTCAPPGGCGGIMQGQAEAACDGGEDCPTAGSTECCFSQQTFSTGCVTDGTCRETGGKEICVTNADCAVDETCCSDPLLAGIGADGGVCLPAADNCAADLGGG